MKTYLRLLSFAKPLGRFLTPFVFTSLLSSVFGVLNFALLIPLLSTLFNQVDTAQVKKLLNQPSPSFVAFFTSPTKVFNYYFAQAFQEYGKVGTLKFVCVVIILSVLLNNVF